MTEQLRLINYKEIKILKTELMTIQEINVMKSALSMLHKDLYDKLDEGIATTEETVNYSRCLYLEATLTEGIFNRLVEIRG